MWLQARVGTGGVGGDNRYEMLCMLGTGEQGVFKVQQHSKGVPFFDGDSSTVFYSTVSLFSIATINFPYFFLTKDCEITHSLTLLIDHTLGYTHQPETDEK